VLRQTVLKGKMWGPMVHDAGIAALCQQYGIQGLWTADGDFSRFPAIQRRNPLLESWHPRCGEESGGSLSWEPVKKGGLESRHFRPFAPVARMWTGLSQPSAFKIRLPPPFLLKGSLY